MSGARNSFAVEFSPDTTAGERAQKHRGAPIKPCYGGCGAFVKPRFTYCRPCGDLHRVELKRIREIERNRRRHQEGHA